MKNGQRLVGAGMYQTTLQLVKAAPGTGANEDFAVAIGSILSFLQDVEISDMTVDANLHRQPLDSNNNLTVLRCDAITMIGTNLKIRRVRAINWGTHVTPTNGDREGFPFYVQGTGDTLTTGNVDNLIEDCIIEQPDRNPAREVTLINSHDEPAIGSGLFPFATLRNCYINGDITNGTPPPPLAVKSIAYDGAVMTVTTSWPHRFLVNDYVVIAGSSVSSYNGRWGAVATSDGFCSFTIVIGGPYPAPPTNRGITAQLYVARAMLVSGFTRSGSTVTVATPFPDGRRTATGFVFQAGSMKAATTRR